MNIFLILNPIKPFKQSNELTEEISFDIRSSRSVYLSALITIIRHKKLDWKPIHDYGMHLSDTRPPLHVSSDGMILYLIESMSKILEAIQKHPILITISR